MVIVKKEGYDCNIASVSESEASINDKCWHRYDNRVFIVR